MHGQLPPSCFNFLATPAATHFHTPSAHPSQPYRPACRLRATCCWQRCLPLGLPPLPHAGCAAAGGAQGCGAARLGAFLRGLDGTCFSTKERLCCQYNQAARVLIAQYVFVFNTKVWFKKPNRPNAVCPSLLDRKLPRFGSGSELQRWLLMSSITPAHLRPHPAIFFLL